MGDSGIHGKVFQSGIRPHGPGTDIWSPVSVVARTAVPPRDGARQHDIQGVGDGGPTRQIRQIIRADRPPTGGGTTTDRGPAAAAVGQSATAAPAGRGGSGWDAAALVRLWAADAAAWQHPWP